MKKFLLGLSACFTTCFIIPFIMLGFLAKLILLSFMYGMDLASHYLALFLVRKKLSKE